MLNCGEDRYIIANFREDIDYSYGFLSNIRIVQSRSKAL